MNRRTGILPVSIFSQRFRPSIREILKEKSLPKERAGGEVKGNAINPCALNLLYTLNKPRKPLPPK